MALSGVSPSTAVPAMPGFTISIDKAVAILDRASDLKPNVQLLGAEFGSGSVWSSDEVLEIVDTSVDGPQGRTYFWTLATRDSLFSLGVPSARRWARGESIVEGRGRGYRRELYNLRQDPEEKTQLGKQESQKLSEMKALFEQTFKQIPSVEPSGGMKLQSGRKARGPVGPPQAKAKPKQ